MKKFIGIFIAVVLIILSILYGYFTYTKSNNSILKQNSEYEKYLNQEIYGAELATIMNKVIDNNEEKSIDKDNKGKYIDNNIDSIKMDILITDNETLYDVETIYHGGIENFVKNFNTIKFKCTEIKYHETTNKIKYLLFQQITN